METDAGAERRTINFGIKLAWRLDEHLDHPEMIDYLRACSAEKVTTIPALGFQMISRQFPKPDVRLCTTRTFRFPRSDMSKLSIFNLDAIEKINYDPGRHRSAQTGRVFAPRRDEVLNRHYKYIDVDYVRERHRALRARLSKEEVERGSEVLWFYDDEALLQEWANGEKIAVDPADPGLNLDEVHRETIPLREHKASRQRLLLAMIGRGSA